MKKVYDFMSTSENMSWCKPLSFLWGKVVVAMNECEIAGCQVNGEDRDEYTTYGKRENTEYAWKALAQLCNPDYAEYRGYSDFKILMDSDYEELGCADCPWRDECDAMDDEESLIRCMGEEEYYAAKEAEYGEC